MMMTKAVDVRPSECAMTLPMPGLADSKLPGISDV
jgi:hypothetical protein